MPISYTVDFGETQPKESIVIFNKHFQTGSRNDVREILTVFSLRI